MSSFFPILMQGKELNGDTTSFIFICIVLLVVGLCIVTIIKESN